MCGVCGAACLLLCRLRLPERGRQSGESQPGTEEAAAYPSCNIHIVSPRIEAALSSSLPMWKSKHHNRKDPIRDRQQEHRHVYT